MNRPSKLRTFMNIAVEWSKLSTCSSRIAVGAVIVNEFDQIIASGYNGSPRGLEHCDDVGCSLDSDLHCTRAIHAEENAILQCALNGVSTRGCTMVVTHSPCPKCALRIVQANIVGVFYSSEYSGVLETLKVFKKSEILLKDVGDFI